MALYFLDASALVKLYVAEAGTDSLLRVVEEPRVRLAVIALTRIECRSALRRRQRGGDLQESLAGEILARLDEDMSRTFFVQPIDSAVIGEAVRLVDRHVLRAYDAIQLAGCNVLRTSLPDEEVVFACSDVELLRAAAAEELVTFDPTRGNP